MSSHKSKKRKSPSSGAATARRSNGTVGVASRPASTIARPSASSGPAAERAPKVAKAATNGAGSAVVRRKTVTPPGYRSRMNRAARVRRQRSIIAGTVIGVVALTGLGILLWNQLPVFHPQASKHTTGQTCATNAQTGLDGTPAAAGGPPAVSGKLVTLGQCLQYIDIKTGDGAAVKDGDTVTVSYTGWLTNGKKFDSSADHPGQPFSFTVGQGQVIPGWDTGLIGMKQGGQRRLFIPAALAYGAQGSPPTIPPNATLIFDVTVTNIK